MLKYVFWHITNRCNLRCRHCWVSSESTSHSRELTTSEAINLIDELSALQPKFVKITGGEPFVRSDISRLIKYIRRKGIKYIIETNGTLLNKESISLLRSFPPTDISVSLDGSNKETHEWIRGGVDSFKRACNAIKLLSAEKLNTHVIMTVNKKNYHQIEEVYMLSKKLGASHFKVTFTIPWGRASKEMKDYLLDPLQMINLFKKVNDLIEKSDGLFVSGSVPPAFLSFHSIQKLKGVLITGCDFPVLTILPDGSISICGLGITRKELVFGKIRSRPIKEIWETDHKLNVLKNISYKDIKGVCSICIFKKVCKGGCRVLAYDAYGSFTAPNPICQMLYNQGLFPENRLIK